MPEQSQRITVCGAGGFIGHHLVKRLKAQGHWVRGVDLKYPEFESSIADEFELLDLRERLSCTMAVRSHGVSVDAVYQLAADMGGMGFIGPAERQIVHNNTLINVNMVDAASIARVPRYFFSSSACVYPDMPNDAKEIKEDGAYPAMPDNEYGWEKLYAERVALTYARNSNSLFDVRIGRFQNCYGPLGTWYGGREKAPAALCRKVAMAEDGGSIDVWGDGSAVRNFIYIEDLLDGIEAIMQAPKEQASGKPINIGTKQRVTVNALARLVAKVANKRLTLNHISGPVGVQSRKFSNAKLRSLGWSGKYTLLDGLAPTYQWIMEQVNGGPTE